MNQDIYKPIKNLILTAATLTFQIAYFCTAQAEQEIINLDAPYYMVAFFEGDCPTESWNQLESGSGRLIAGTVDRNKVNLKVGASPLKEGVVSSHTHTFDKKWNGSFPALLSVPAFDWYTPSSESKRQTTTYNQKKIQANSVDLSQWAPASSSSFIKPGNADLPYIALSVCERLPDEQEQKVEQPRKSKDSRKIVLDPLPFNSVAFFNPPSPSRCPECNMCPDGWIPLTEAADHFIVPTTESGETGKSVDTVLQHDHVQLTNVMYAVSGVFTSPMKGFGETQIGVYGIYFKGLTSVYSDHESTPYLYLSACKKSVSITSDKTPPIGLLNFQSADNCSTGWEDYSQAGGRTIVGRIDPTKTAMIWGGPPLKNQEVRTHIHDTTLPESYSVSVSKFSESIPGGGLVRRNVDLREPTVQAAGYKDSGDLLTIGGGNKTDPAGGIPYISYRLCSQQK